MSEQTSSISVNLLARTKPFVDEFNKAQNVASNFSSNMESMSRKMGSVGATMTKAFTVPITAIGGSLLALQNNFDDAYANIRAGTGATGQSLQDLENNFRNVYGSSSFNMSDTSNTIADVNTMLGLQGKELEDVSDKYLKLNRIIGGDVSQTIDKTTKAMNAFDIDDHGGFLDYLFKVSQETGKSVDAISNDLVRYGDIMALFGMGFEESAALIGQFNKAGVNSELVLGSMRQAMSRFAEAGKDPEQALQATIALIKEMEDEAQALQLANNIFGSRAGADMVATIQKDAFDIGPLTQALQQNESSIEGVYSEVINYTDRLQEMKNKLVISLEPVAENLTSVFEGLFPYLEQGIEWVGGLVESFERLDESTQMAAIAGLTFLAVLGPTLIFMSKIIAAGKVMYGVFKAIAGSKAVATLAGKGLIGVTSSLIIVFAKISVVFAGFISLLFLIEVGFSELWKTFKFYGYSMLGFTSYFMGEMLKVMTSKVRDIGEIWNRFLGLFGVDRFQVDLSWLDAPFENASKYFFGKALKEAEGFEETLSLKDFINDKLGQIGGLGDDLFNYDIDPDDLINEDEIQKKLDNIMPDLELNNQKMMDDILGAFGGNKLGGIGGSGGLGGVSNAMNQSSNKMQDAADKMERAMEQIQRSFSNTRDSLKDYVGYFASVDRANFRATNSFRLMRNAMDQERAYKEREKALATIESRGATRQVMDDLSSLGISELGNLKGLANLDDDNFRRWMEIQGRSNIRAQQQAVDQTINNYITVNQQDRSDQAIVNVILRELGRRGVPIGG